MCYWSLLYSSFCLYLSIHTGDAAAHVSRLLTVKQTMHHSGDILKLLNFHVSFLHRLMAGEFRL